MDATTRYLARGEEIFPNLLAEIPSPPIGMYLRGTMPAKDQPSIAIVGTRRATPAGKALAAKFARELAARGFSIISGLAFGIDAAAHGGALEAGGHTVAVLPCGLDQIYPRSNAALAEKIIKSGGALVSEYPPETPALPYRFLERNRIVSGLSRGSIIIEAPERSGALVTARFAAEQGRDCFIVPGPHDHPNFIGSHELIRKGAELITKIEHVLEAYGMTGETKDTTKTTETRKRKIGLTDEETKIFDYLSSLKVPTEVDKIINESKLQPQAVNIAITLLLIKGLIKETAGGYMLN